MVPKKAYIIRTPNPKSQEYSEIAAETCRKVGMPFEFLEWFQGEAEKSWQHVGIPKVSGKLTGNVAAHCCWTAHLACMKKILDSGQAGIILEHDAMMLHKPTISIPDDMIVVLGYKLKDPNAYDYISAGPPSEIVDVNSGGHEGSHAYAITPKTAETWIEEVQRNGIPKPIDNAYFLRSRKSKIGIKIMSPCPAIAWVRESTIQPTASFKNYPFIDSFQNHCIEKEVFGKGITREAKPAPEPKRNIDPYKKKNELVQSHDNVKVNRGKLSRKGKYYK